MELQKARCCMFDEPDAEKAVKEADLELVETLYDGGRHWHCVSRCMKCGALVMRQDEELADYDWDNAHMFNRYYPIESLEEARELEGKHLFASLAGVRRHIEVSYFEENIEDREYRYRGKDFCGR